MNATPFIRKPLFALGAIVSTPGALKALQAEGLTAHELLHRHQRGDWGDVPDEDRRENALALTRGSRIFSAYRLPRTGAKLWIITEHDRSVTTLLLPQEY